MMIRLLVLLLIISLNLSISVKKVVIVGSGWGGIGACKTLCETQQENCKVILIDALKDASGGTPYLTPTGKPFEAGVKGFWYDYPNIYSVLENFVNIKQDDVFTPCTNSSFYSPFGLEATAPVFSDSLALPSPLGQIFASLKLFERLPVIDRITMIGLLYAMLDFDRDEETIMKYDRMNAHDLFVKFKLSKRLVDDFIKPTLLVGLFKPPEELSAAVVMELLYYYALAHQNSFDVKWIKQKSIAETITYPIVNKLQKEYGLEVISNSRVNKMILNDENKISAIEYINDGKKEIIEDIDAVILAVGASGLKGILNNSPEISYISPELTKASSLNSVSCISTRIWLDKKVQTRSPANVFSRFPSLRGSGGTFFMLDQLQYQTKIDLWQGDEKNVNNSVLACDFYNSAALNSCSNDDIVNILMNDLLPSAVPEFKNVKVIDSHVVRFKDAVSWFSPGSYECRPKTENKDVRNLFMAGDWVRLDRDIEAKTAKGLCQERAFVTGIVAANSLIDKVLDRSKKGVVIPIREDEPQVKIGKLLNKRIMGFLKPLGLDSPWVR